MKSFDPTFNNRKGGLVIFAIIAASPPVTFIPHAKWALIGAHGGRRKLRVLKFRFTGKAQRSKYPIGQHLLITFSLEEENCTDEGETVWTWLATLCGGGMCSFHPFHM